ncbi:molybdopterin-synthase adenylyltransferase MoeB [Marinomonas sp. THO17]|uniref:HesA/MoeB/ThiF family protein n=1 Tax=Marinomonas sp. THO17 TaxID=3149048 RepID=UPI00336BF2BB
MNEFELDRYSRQILLNDFDISGQLKLKEARVLIVGLGGLGNIAATYLATSGVGHLLLVDDDVIEASNLPRQVLYNENQIGQSKVAAAAEQLKQKNPGVEIDLIGHRLTENALLETLEKVDLVLDCTDNFATRQGINRACWQQKTPLVSAAAIRWEGQLVSFLFDQVSAPCYECLYPNLSDQALSCHESGILSPVVGLLGVYQALEAIKVLSGAGCVEHGSLKLFDGFQGRWREMRLTQDKECQLCSKVPSLT